MIVCVSVCICLPPCACFFALLYLFIKAFVCVYFLCVCVCAFVRLCGRSYMIVCVFMCVCVCVCLFVYFSVLVGYHSSHLNCKADFHWIEVHFMQMALDVEQEKMVMAIPPKDNFSEQTIENYVTGKQNFRKGRLLVACGDVWDIKLVTIIQCDPPLAHFAGFCHAEMTANMFYLVQVFFSKTGIVWSLCVCTARVNRHDKCKHISALLHALFLLKNHLNTPPKWITQRRRKVKRFAHPGWKIHTEIHKQTDTNTHTHKHTHNHI